MFSPADKGHADAQLPHCIQASISLAPSLLTSLYKSGLMLFFLKIFPLKSHKWANRKLFLRPSK